LELIPRSQIFNLNLKCERAAPPVAYPKSTLHSGQAQAARSMGCLPPGDAHGVVLHLPCVTWSASLERGRASWSCLSLTHLEVGTITIRPVLSEGQVCPRVVVAMAVPGMSAAVLRLRDSGVEATETH